MKTKVQGSIHSPFRLALGSVEMDGGWTLA